MMYFSELCIGDMFNTKVARWVKINDYQAICVQSGLIKLGSIQDFNQQQDVVLLYSSQHYYD